jgi:beta-glucosidase
VLDPEVKTPAVPDEAREVHARQTSAVASIEARVDEILSAATLDEKIAMMSGRGFFTQFRASQGRWCAEPYRAGGGVDRLGVPALYFTDGPRGVSGGNSTCFPSSMARGATFDAELERRIGEAMGVEIRAHGCNFSGAVCINLLRHPAWGRAQETYGEDPWHLGVMGASLGLGIQAHNVVASVKHFALNSMENARFHIDVSVDERALHEVYLPHFKHVIDAGVGSVMSAYNRVNGEYCGQSRVLLTDILRGEWGFEGFVHSDWIKGVHEPYAAAAGLDVENPEPIVYARLAAAIENGSVAPEVVDQACQRILRTQLRLTDRQDPLLAYTPDLVASENHRALALEAALKSMVLLENDGVLPLARQRTGKLAVLGRLATLENTGDNGSSRVHPPYVVTFQQGLQAELGADAILHGDETDLAGARRQAMAADAVVVVAGYTAEEEGEFVEGDVSLGMASPDEPVSPHGGDRLELGLPADQIALIRAASESGKPVIVVLVGGAAILVEGWRDQVNAIIHAFYPGMEGGRALPKLLFGQASPSGRLPFTVAKSEEDYPFFDRDAKAITYDYWHGYTKFDREGLEPRYRFGHGLAYTRFGYRGATARRHRERIEATLAVTNLGDMAADDTVFLFIGFPGRAAERPIKILRGFERVWLEPGQTKIVRLSVDLATLTWRDPTTHDWKLESGPHRIMLGGDSAELLEVVVDL